MAQTCSVCKHADRAAIEAAHVDGRSLRGIASQFAGTSPWSLARHFKHVPAIIAKMTEHQVQQNAATGKLPARVEKLIAEAESLTMTARRKRDFTSALAAIRTRLSCLELLGRLTGELRPGGPVGEFIPGNAAAAAQASVTVNVPAPARSGIGLANRLRQIYNLVPLDDDEPKLPIN